MPDEKTAEKKRAIVRFLAQSGQTAPDRAQAQYELGKIYRQESELDSARSCFFEAIGLSRSAQLKAEISNALGSVYLSQGSTDSAMHYFLSALEYFETHGDRQGRARVSNNLAILHRSSRDYVQAEYYVRMALRIYSEEADSARYGQSLNTLGTLYLARDRRDSAEAIFERAVEIKRKHDGPSGLASSLNNLAMLRSERGDSGAEALFLESIALREQVSDASGQASSWINLCEFYLDRQKYERAEEASDRARRLIGPGELELELRWQTSRAKLMQLSGRSAEATTHYELALLYTDSLHDQTSSAHVLELERKYRMGRDLAEKSALVAQDNERRARRAARRWSFFAALGFSVSLLVLAVFMWRKNKAVVRLNHQYLEAKKQAEDRAIFKAKTLQNMSHELRTPLNGILGLSELLEFEAEGSQRELVGMLRQSAKRLLETIESILGFGKLDSGEDELSVQTASVEALIEGALESLRPAAKSKEIELRWAVQDGLRWNTDERMLRIVIQNLVGNAVKYSPSNTAVGIRAFKTDSNELGSADLLVVEVVDRGSGIAPEDRERIFQPYVQGSQGLAKSHQGSGLGLAIALGYAKLLGGDIAYLDANPGSCFRLSIPQLQLSADSERGESAS